MKYNFKTKHCPWRNMPNSVCDFRVIDQMASSNRCVVYVATYENQLCVMKRYTKYNLDVDSIRAIISEIDIHASLDHPHIVPLFCVLEDHISINLVMECCEMDLFEYNRLHGPFTEKKAVLEIIHPMIKACMYLHDHGIIHTDIKPENIFFSKEGVWKLGDFGLAINAKKVKLTHIQGTHFYIPPEVLTDTVHEGEEGRIDVWAIGVLVNELLAKEIPVPRKDPVTKVHTFHDMIDVSISEDAKDFITHATFMDASKRPTSHELSQWKWLQANLQGNVPTKKKSILLRLFQRQTSRPKEN